MMDMKETEGEEMKEVEKKEKEAEVLIDTKGT
jgi:hypothetical protein